MRQGWLFSLALVAALLVAAPVAAQVKSLNGAGATFPAPVYTKWAYRYNQETGIKVNYQAIGSGGGIAQIKAKTVDFGGTDAPLKPEELKKYGIFQFPTVMGGVVPIFNVKGMKSGDLKIDGPTLAKIFMGEIAKWNDPAIKKMNPEAKLPDQNITVVHRSDGSGTTFIFTSYLSKISSDFKSKVGAGKAVKWPGKNSVGAKGNPGVAGQTQNINGAVGYVEYAYAHQNKIPVINMKNKAGKIVEPNLDTFQAAASNADWNNAPPGFALMMIDQPGDDSWPICGLTWIMIYQDQPNAAKGKAILKFFDWCYANGDKMAKELHYGPMPDNVVKMVQDGWAQEIKSGGKSLWP